MSFFGNWLWIYRLDLTYPGPQFGDVSRQIVGRDILQKGILTNNPTKTAHFKTGRIATEDSISKTLRRATENCITKYFFIRLKLKKISKFRLRIVNKICTLYKISLGTKRQFIIMAGVKTPCRCLTAQSYCRMEGKVSYMTGTRRWETWLTWWHPTIPFPCENRT